MASLRIIMPGLLTTIQDLGRWNWQAQGVPVAGPMDPYSHRLANALVGNSEAAATLEITLAGPEVEFDDDRTAVVTGADFDVSLNGEPQPMCAPFAAPTGAVLRVGRRRRGARAYLAISGGIAAPPVLGSRSTHLPSRMGGLDGRALRAGDRVPLGEKGGRASSPKRGRTALPEKGYGAFSRPVVRVLPGPQLDRFRSGALAALQSAPYTVLPTSNRMGFRLEGPRLERQGDAEMLSDAVTFGALQAPMEGQPILLMADRPATGGYPSIATVISADIGLAGQLAPGDSISFVVCSRREAIAALISQEQALLSVEGGRPVEPH